MTNNIFRSVTVLVVTFNRKALLERCLSALTAQIRPPGQILVVDNASSNGTVGWFSGWVANLPSRRA